MSRTCRNVLVLFVALMIVVCAWGVAQAACGEPPPYWTNAGDQELKVNSNYYPPGGEGGVQRFVAPGSKLRFTVEELLENDTYHEYGEPPEQHDDSWKQGRLIKTGGTLGGEEWKEEFTQLGTYEYPVPGDAEPGKTIIIKAQIHDTRDPAHCGVCDARHDDWNDIDTWGFTVSTDCPESMTVVIVEDKSGSRPNPGESYGNYRTTMQANGDPPEGRPTWNGTTVTEQLGPLEGNPAKFKPNIIGTGAGYGSTFTFGTAWDEGQQQYLVNKFYDWHKMEYSYLILKDGYDEGVLTKSQEYICSTTKEYPFTITRTCNLDEGRIKVTVTK